MDGKDIYKLAEIVVDKVEDKWKKEKEARYNEEPSTRDVIKYILVTIGCLILIILFFGLGLIAIDWGVYITKSYLLPPISGFK